MIITRKIELYVIGSTPEERSSAWRYIRNLTKDVSKAYNLVSSNQYFNDMFTERIRKTDSEISHRDRKLQMEIEKLTEAIKATKDKEEKKKLTEKRKISYKELNMLNSEARKKAEEMYCTSEQNSTYQLIAKQFPNMPSSITATLNMDAVKGYRNDAFDVKMGNKSIKTYRNTIPIPFDKKSMRFEITPKKEVRMDWLNNISFMLNFGKDKSNNREIVNRAIDGTYKYSNSKIQIKDNKIFLLFCVNIPEEKQELNEDIVVGVNLGIVVPAYCALNKGKDRLALGDMDDLFRVRIQMQERRRRLQKQLRMAQGGHGRTDKLKALERVSEAERNFVKTYNHMLSSQIVKFAKKNGAKYINMELLEGYAENERDSIILRNWSYFELHKMTEYKAQKLSMVVRYTDPYRISQTCNCCGVYNPENLKNRNDFICQNEECKNHNVKVLSDYNAGLNNAMTDKIVEKKEDCEFYKKHLTEA